jgi:hypothetical protein
VTYLTRMLAQDVSRASTAPIVWRASGVLSGEDIATSGGAYVNHRRVIDPRERITWDQEIEGRVFVL